MGSQDNSSGHSFFFITLFSFQEDARDAPEAYFNQGRIFYRLGKLKPVRASEK